MEEKTTSLSTGQQQFNLRWNNHTNNILEVFTEQLNNEALVDVTISCEGQYLKAHKMILSACSPYFQVISSHFFHLKFNNNNGKTLGSFSSSHSITSSNNNKRNEVQRRETSN